MAASSNAVLAVALALGVGWLASRHTRTVTYSVPSPVTQVDLELSSGDAVIVGSSLGR